MKNYFVLFSFIIRQDDKPVKHTESIIVKILSISAINIESIKRLCRKSIENKHTCKCLLNNITILKMERL
jgi:hypothetical protein